MLFVLKCSKVAILKIVLQFTCFFTNFEGTHDVEENISTFHDLLCRTGKDVVSIVLSLVQFIEILIKVDRKEKGFIFILLANSFELLFCILLAGETPDES